MKSCFGYIRVSTQKQGEGVSLQEQKSAIESFALGQQLSITAWYEEKETAAKGGRPIFNRMLRDLKRLKTHGVVIHKIDRSARNLRDWSAISELADAGIDVYFATESLDFRSRGGRLTADIQAVIAADYIRNLREETIKGLQGRLKQGLYPFKAPVGYLDQGRGQAKIPDPRTAPIVTDLFERYATGQYTYLQLIDYAARQGLKNQKGGNLSLHGIETVLGNSFYAGLIHIKRTGQTYAGVHEPLISMRLFNHVKAIRTGRRGQITTKHRHRFRRLFRCGLCGACMIPELQKGHCYYRCKRRDCATKTVREDMIEASIRRSLKQLELTTAAERAVQEQQNIPTSENELAVTRKSVELQFSDICAQQQRLEELVLDGTFDREQYRRRKAELDARHVELSQALARMPSEAEQAQLRAELAELQKSLCLTYELAGDDEKRIFIESVWPNRQVIRRSVELEPSDWLQDALSGKCIPYGDPVRGRGRTLQQLLAMMNNLSKRTENLPDAA
jgi:site-specific DNA recombinase